MYFQLIYSKYIFLTFYRIWLLHNTLRRYVFCCCQVLIKDNGKKRELVVGVVRAKHNLHEAAGESDDTIGYQASDGLIRNSCEKRLIGVAQLVEGNIFNVLC